jgi:hypothetical protein
MIKNGKQLTNGEPGLTIVRPSYGRGWFWKERRM